MDPIKFCQLKHGTCVCAKNGEANCAQVKRQAADPNEIAHAEAMSASKRQARRARYIQDEWPPKIAVDSHLADTRAALRRWAELADSVKRYEDRMTKHIRGESYMFRGIESVFHTKHIEGPEIRERRLGSSDKPHIKFMKDPVKCRPK